MDDKQAFAQIEADWEHDDDVDGKPRSKVFLSGRSEGTPRSLEPKQLNTGGSDDHPFGKNGKGRVVLPANDEILEEAIEFVGSSFKNASKQDFDATMGILCIFCQAHPSAIIFEPCGHCLVCEKCASWSCNTFCPRCRSSISKRKRSTSVFRGISLDLAQKPMTVSPFSFMDIS